MTMTPQAVARDIQEREHELFPDKTDWKHLDCRVCGPGPLKRGELPSAYPHVWYKTEKEALDNGYTISMVEVRRECMPQYAQTVSSEIDDRRGWHTPMLDIDLPARLIESSTPGHYHLYIDHPIPWWRYKRLLKALMKAGIIEKNYYKASVARKGTHLRPPWGLKTM